MKSNILYIIALFVAITAMCCQKEIEAPPVSTSLKIANAIAGATPVVANFDNSKPLVYYRTAQQIAANGFFAFSGYIGNIPLAISQFSDTTRTIFTGTINLDRGNIRTLYLGGTLANVDTLYTTDRVTSTADSVIKIRFINFSPGSTPINVNLQGSQSSPVTSNLSYKSIADYQPFSATKAKPASNNYVFEFREASNGRLIATYTLNQVIPSITAFGQSAGKVFKSFTILLKGIPGGTGTSAQTTMIVNDY